MKQLISKVPERTFNQSVFESLRGWGWVAEVTLGTTRAVVTKLDGEATWTADKVFQGGRPVFVHGLFERTVVTQPVRPDIAAQLDELVALGR